MSPTTGFLPWSGLVWCKGLLVWATAVSSRPISLHGVTQDVASSCWPTLTMHPWTAHSKTRSPNLKSASSLALSYPNTFISFFGCFQFACFTGLFFVDGLIPFDALLSVLASLLKQHGSLFSRTVDTAIHNTSFPFWSLSAILPPALFILGNAVAALAFIGKTEAWRR